tara:strand:- start:234 stop:1445 length:1212 start_codon:yes stop_codon:yes gene_type:complete
MSRSLLSKTSRMGAVNPVAGAIFGAASNQDETAMQVGGSAAQVTTVQVASAANDTTYTLSIGEDAGSLIAVTFTTPSSGNTTTTVATGIANAINAKVGVSNIVFASSASDTVTITGRQKGASATFTVSESDARLNTPSTTTSAGDATAIPFGVMVERSSATKAVGTAAIGSAIGSGTYTAQIAKSVDLGSTLTIAAGDVLSLTVSGDFDGLGVKDFTVTQPHHTDENTTIDYAVAGLNGALPANSVAVTESANVLTFTAEVAGVGFTVSGYGLSSGTATALTFAESGTVANAIPNGGGIALKSHTIEQDDNGDSKYEMGDTFSGLTEGKVYVLLDSGITVAEGDACFVRKTTTGTEQAGAFSNVSDGGDNLPISAYGFKGIWVGSNETDMNGNNVAPLYISRA